MEILKTDDFFLKKRKEMCLFLNSILKFKNV